MNDLLYGLHRTIKNAQDAIEHLRAQDDLGSMHRVQELSVWHTELTRLLNNYYERQAKVKALVDELKETSIVKSHFTEEEILKQLQLKSNSYKYHTKDYSFETIYGEPGMTLFNLSYKKKITWSCNKQSKFIESTLLGVPLTPFIVSENKDGSLDIIDGCQRIKTLIDFYDNKIRLAGLQKLTTLNGIKYRNLPDSLQLHLWCMDFRTIIVDRYEYSIGQDLTERLNLCHKNSGMLQSVNNHSKKLKED